MSVQTPDEDGRKKLEVPCTAGVNDTKWRESPLNGGLLAFYDPCGTCWPNLDDDPEPEDLDVDVVLRSTNNSAKSIHLRKCDTPADHPIVKEGELHPNVVIGRGEDA